MSQNEERRLTNEQKRAIGSRILQRRKERRWSQRELGRRTGIPFLRLSRMENGHVTTTVPELVLLGRALGVSLDELVTGTPPAEAPSLRRLGPELLELEEFTSPEECAALGGLLRALLAGLKAGSGLPQGAGR